MMMVNLWDETQKFLSDLGLTWDDVVYVACGNNRITKENFERVARETNYNGFGSAHIASDIVLVGYDWWVVRSEYDGKEWWQFHSRPEVANHPDISVDKLSSEHGGTLPCINESNSET